MTAGRSSFDLEFGKFVRARRGEENLEAFAHRAGVSMQTVGRMQRGYIPPAESVARIARGLGEDPAEWLAAASYPDEPLSVGPAHTFLDTNVFLPIGGVVGDGGRLTPAEKDELNQFECARRDRAAADFVLQIIGDTSFPVFVAGDVVAIKKARRALPGQIVLVEGKRDKLLLCYGGRRGGKPIFTFPNALYPPIRQESLEIVGVAVWQHRSADSIRDFGH